MFCFEASSLPGRVFCTLHAFPWDVFALNNHTVPNSHIQYKSTAAVIQHSANKLLDFLQGVQQYSNVILLLMENVIL